MVKMTMQRHGSKGYAHEPFEGTSLQPIPFRPSKAISALTDQIIAGMRAAFEAEKPGVEYTFRIVSAAPAIWYLDPSDAMRPCVTVQVVSEFTYETP